MDKTPSPESTNQTTEPPEPEALVARSDDGTPEQGSLPTPSVTTPLANKARHRRTYRPSHKATFIGLAVVVAILAINAGVLGFVLKSKSKNNGQNNDQVTISKAALSKVGVNTSSIGDSGVVLTIGPTTQFNSKVTVDGDVSIGGQLKLNSKFTASDATLTQLQAGKVSFSELNVSGISTLTSLNLRNGLVVAGSTQLQGPVTINQLLTLNNSLIVVGNLAVGGTLSTKTFSATSLTSTGTLTIGGHVITTGLSPSVGRGGAALGSNGTVSVSGNDAAGTIAINIGSSAGSGILADVAFHSQFSSAPHVVITPVGVACTFYITNLSLAGFSVGDGCNLPPGGYAIEYIIEQ
jgi:hypothetical protein